MLLYQLYHNYMDHHERILTELELVLKQSRQFELLYKDFEAQKVCYLPLNTFLLKPAQRLLHYKLILESKSSPSSICSLFCKFNRGVRYNIW